MRKSNSMEVKNMVRRHIADSLDATTVEELKQALADMEEQIEINRTINMSYQQAVAYTIEGLYKGFLFRTDEIKQFNFLSNIITYSQTTPLSSISFINTFFIFTNNNLLFI